jgi:hypothetical protein
MVGSSDGELNRPSAVFAAQTKGTSCFCGEGAARHWRVLFEVPLPEVTAHAATLIRKRHTPTTSAKLQSCCYTERNIDGAHMKCLYFSFSGRIA